MLEALGHLPELVVNGVNTVLEGMGNGVATFFQNIFLVNTAAAGETPAWEVSTFGAVSFVVLGITLSIGITTWVVKSIKGRQH